MSPRLQLRLRRSGGFTLIELLVALAAMALLALMSWRGLDGMIRVQASTQTRMQNAIALQTGLAQWSADLDAIMETGQVSAVDYDGRVLRMTRRDTSLQDNPMRVVGWARRVIPGEHDARGSWARWQSPPLRTRAELLEAWARAESWGQNASDEEIRREVAVLGLAQWQVFYYRNDGWSNPLSTAGGTTAPPSTGNAIAPVPDGIRIMLTLSEGQPLAGVLTKDWVRPVLGGGKS